jgi:hypothetical protein
MMNLLTLRPLSSRLGAAPTADTPECLPAPIRLHRRPAPAPRFDAAAMAAFELGDHAGLGGFPPPPEGDNAEDAPREDPQEEAVSVDAQMARELDYAICKPGGFCEMLVKWCQAQRVPVFTPSIAEAVPADVLRAWIALPQGEGWRLHRPGDPMPCDGNQLVRIAFADGAASASVCPAANWCWDRFGRPPTLSELNIIAWRPA